MHFCCKFQSFFCKCLHAARAKKRGKKTVLAQLVYDSYICLYVCFPEGTSQQCVSEDRKCSNITSCVCLPCMTASSHICVTPALIFTKLPGSLADNTQMTLSHVLKGRASTTQSSTLPYILQEHFQRSTSALLKCADKGELCCLKFSNISHNSSPGKYSPH